MPFRLVFSATLLDLAQDTVIAHLIRRIEEIAAAQSRTQA